MPEHGATVLRALCIEGSVGAIPRRDLAGAHREPRGRLTEQLILSVLGREALEAVAAPDAERDEADDVDPVPDLGREAVIHQREHNGAGAAGAAGIEEQ